MDVLVSVGMYLRTIRRRNKDGSVVEYLQLAHNVRRPNGVVCAEVVHNFGRADQVDREALHRLARSLHRLDEGEGGGSDLNQWIGWEEAGGSAEGRCAGTSWAR